MWHVLFSREANFVPLYRQHHQEHLYCICAHLLCLILEGGFPLADPQKVLHFKSLLYESFISAHLTLSSDQPFCFGSFEKLVATPRSIWIGEHHRAGCLLSANPSVPIPSHMRFGDVFKKRLRWQLSSWLTHASEEMSVRLSWKKGRIECGEELKAVYDMCLKINLQSARLRYLIVEQDFSMRARPKR